VGAYRKFTHATHQSCLAYLLRRCDELLGDAQRDQAKTPHAVRRILQQALAVRDARDAGQLDTTNTTPWAERLGATADKLITGRTAYYPPNRRLLDHLGRERAALFTFLRTPGVQATNWRAEYAIRPTVVCRKQWAGNATWNGARTWQVLASVLRTATQQHHDPVALLAGLLHAPGPPWPTSLSPPQRRARKPNPVTNYSAAWPDARTRQDCSARVVIAGQAFVQNVGRGHYELAVEAPVPLRLAVAFDELALAI
jgi:Transposase IS66 family